VKTGTTKGDDGFEVINVQNGGDVSVAKQNTKVSGKETIHATGGEKASNVEMTSLT